MVKIKLIAVGKLKEQFYIEACKEYCKRLEAFCKLEIRELPEGGGLEREAAAIRGEIPKGAYCIALCIEGKLCSSEALAQLVDRAQITGNSTLCFLIGSSEGMSETVKKEAHVRLSMSPMTFPHHLARVMVLEQIYRAFHILSGGKYHK